MPRAIAATELPHAGRAYPHVGSCHGCRWMMVCNFCGQPALPSERCTNGRCGSCHGTQCTSGGVTYPGHGFGPNTPAR
jgi:hypothetical protein